MSKPFRIILPILALATLAAANLPCPNNATATVKNQGNTRMLSCLDSLGRPHGPFEVWVYADTTRSGNGLQIVKGRFSQGKRVGEWTTFGQNGQVVETSRFEDGIKVENGHEDE